MPAAPAIEFATLFANSKILPNLGRLPYFTDLLIRPDLFEIYAADLPTLRGLLGSISGRAQVIFLMIACTRLLPLSAWPWCTQIGVELLFRLELWAVV